MKSASYGADFCFDSPVSVFAEGMELGMEFCGDSSMPTGVSVRDSSDVLV